MKLKRSSSSGRSRLFFLKHVKNARAAFINGLLVTAFLGSSGGLNAADLLSMPVTENQLSHSSRAFRSDESFATSLVIESQQNVLSEAILSGDDQDSQHYLLPSVNRAHLILSKSITDRLALHLGVQGISAQTSAQAPVLFPDSADHKAAGDSFNFAGASLLLKLKLAGWDKFSIYATPFVESGAGGDASYDLTRSVQPKGGWAVQTDLRPMHAFGVVLSGGARYRNEEEVGSLKVGDEIFYGGALTAYLPANLALSVGGDGRAVDVTRTSKQEHSELQKLEDGRWFTRIHSTSDRLILALQYSKKIAGTNGFGFGEQAITAQIGYAFGGIGRKASLADDVITPKEDHKAVLKSKDQSPLDAASEDHVTKEKYPEMIGAGIDPLEIVEDNSSAEKEFLEAEKKAQEIEKLNEKPTPSQVVEQELEVLHAAEAKAEQERAEEEKRQLEEERENSRERMHEYKEQWNEWVEEATEEASEIDGISPEEFNWNGLE